MEDCRRQADAEGEVSSVGDYIMEFLVEECGGGEFHAVLCGKAVEEVYYRFEELKDLGCLGCYIGVEFRGYRAGGYD